jgi:hypothetical protein
MIRQRGAVTVAAHPALSLRRDSNVRERRRGPCYRRRAPEAQESVTLRLRKHAPTRLWETSGSRLGRIGSRLGFHSPRIGDTYEDLSSCGRARGNRTYRFRSCSGADESSPKHEPEFLVDSAPAIIVSVVVHTALQQQQFLVLGITVFFAQQREERQGLHGAAEGAEHRDVPRGDEAGLREQVEPAVATNGWRSPRRGKGPRTLSPQVVPEITVAQLVHPASYAQGRAIA